MSSVISYATAKEVVAAFNDLRCVRKAAVKTGVDRDTTRAVTQFLWDWTFKQVDPSRSVEDLPKIKISAPAWCAYLYTSNATVEQAAASLGVEPEAVLRLCGEAREWAKKSARKPLRARMEADFSVDNGKDPDEEEIYRRAAAEREARPGDPDEDWVPPYITPAYTVDPQGLFHKAN